MDALLELALLPPEAAITAARSDDLILTEYRELLDWVADLRRQAERLDWAIRLEGIEVSRR